MTTGLEKLISQWRRGGVELLPAVEESEVVAALRGTGREFSRDVVALYTTIGGMADDKMDDCCWSLWSLARVQSENAKYQRPYLLFADFLINSHFYCLKYEDDSRSSVHVEWFDEKGPEHVADSLDEFFGLYLVSPEKICL